LGLKTQDDLIGKKNENIKKKKKFLEAWSKKEKAIINSEKSQFDTIEKWTHNNTDLFLDINRILLRDNKDQIIGLLVTMRDITKSRKAKQQLKESELKYRQLLETSSVGVIEIDIKGEKINYINPRFQKIVGYQKEDLSFDTMMKKIIHPKDFERIREKARNASVEFRIITNKGKIKWVNGKKIDETDKYGNIKGFRLWLEDITERKQYEDLIKELNINFLNFSANTEQNIKSLLDTCNKYLGGILTLYCFKSIEHENDKYQILTSEGKSYLFTEEEFSQLFISKYYSIDHDFVQNYLNISNNSYQNTDLFLEDREVKASIGKLIKKQDKITGSICVFFPHNPDFSYQDNLLLFLICDAIEIEQRRWEAQHQLEEQNIVLSKMNKLKSELLSRTSHELKTPLISIKGFTELLLKVHRTKFDTDVISILEEIYDGSKR
jgi:PAS domain S-box-containing protein